ncbi:hypothetical protein N6L27_00060 [Leisingera sp. SS27]|uniref:hypothetical protein n=1 Tax=Leisingera sp. SS27 TaxID=2979462 RepID=UPI00232BD61D|nr:hypothetical protein [Leisingera sp. SS27]MDC0656386.1 hypothetical protein [Leisingera sp. SS27]
MIWIEKKKVGISCPQLVEQHFVGGLSAMQLQVFHFYISYLQTLSVVVAPWHFPKFDTLSNPVT